jgi:hypothetical protein
MTSKKHLVITLIVFILIAALYRALPGREPGFAPHLAMALFAGAMIRDKRWAFAFPIASMIISDVIIQLMFISGLGSMQGFYDGQFINYALFAVLTAIGFLIRKVNVVNVALHSVSISVIFYLLSNFFVWMGGGGFGRPQTFDGLIMCYVDAFPFFRASLYATLIFSAILFGGWALFVRNRKTPAAA